MSTIAAIAVIGCAHSTKLSSADYSYRDNPPEERIELSFKNVSGRDVCLLPEFWPNQAGKVNQGSDIVRIVVNDQVFPLMSTNTGYCPSCVERVRPGETVEGFISYSDFELPETYYELPKQLVFDLKIYACE